MKNISVPIPKGKLMIIGGAENKDTKQEQENISEAVLKKFVSLCGTKAKIVLITSASEEYANENSKAYAKIFKSYGAARIIHLRHNDRSEIKEKDIKEIENANGVFLSGGDQLKLTAIYGGTNLLTVIKKRYISEDIVIAGTSAGAMALSTPMIFEGNEEQSIVAAGMKITTGLEFLRDVCIDTHFVHRGRFLRIVQVIATNPSTIGLGIEENTAVIVEDGFKATVAGNGVVFLIDGVESTGSNISSFDDRKKITIRNLNVSILADTEHFEIPNRNPAHR